MIYILLFGLLIGIIAYQLDPREEGGIIGPAILGILGAVCGSTIAKMVFNLGGEGSLSILLFSVVVSSLLLFISWIVKPLGRS
jgi:uncharacterized membrane protein YeaQ/YmgE (transglycosylase-associated protein family)